jgi:hypothetical protein
VEKPQPQSGVPQRMTILEPAFTLRGYRPPKHGQGNFYFCPQFRTAGQPGLREGIIAAGRHSPALLAELEKRERRLEEISDELLATDGRGIAARLMEVEAFVLSELQNIQGRLTGEIPRAKAELAKHCTEITLTPEVDTYKLSGEWDLLGDVRSDGAGGRNWTERLPVTFVWLAVA